MRPVSFTYAPTVASANAIALSQTPSGAGNLTLNGALVSGGVVTMGDQQLITIFSASNLSGLTFLATGTNKSGMPITETITGPGAGLTVSSTKNFYTVSSIYASGAAGGALTVGVSGLGQSLPVPLDIYLSPLNTSVAVTAITGATYKLQYTYDNVFDSTWPNGTQVWFDHATMTGKTTTADATINNPVTAVRFAITSAGSPQSLSARIVQSGGGL